MLKRLLLSLTFSLSIAVMSVLAQSSSNELVDVRTEVYSVAPTDSGDMDLLVDLYMPSTESIKGAVILTHGGSFVTGSRNLQENIDYGTALAKRGYLAAAISYRLHKDKPIVDGWASDYAGEIRELPDELVQSVINQYGPNWPTAVAASAQDVIAAVDWLRENAPDLGFNPGNIALFGASAGAISSLTISYALDRYGSDASDLSAVIDLRGMLLQAIETGFSISPKDPSLIMFHGEVDKRIPLRYAESLFEIAKEADIHVEFYTAPGFGHELGSNALLKLKAGRDQTVLDRIDEFLQESFDEDLNPDRSLRSRLFPADYQFGPSDKLGDTAIPNDSLFRFDLRLAADSLFQLVREESDFVPSLYGISKEEMLLHNFDDFSRTDWSYWPRERVGLSLRHMTAVQRRQTHNILSILLSSKGYLQVNHIMMLEEVLANIETYGFVRGVEGYMITFFGKPSASDPWGLRFEGHHISLNLTFTPDYISVTPTFLGAYPAPLTEGTRAGFNPLKYEQHYALTLLELLNEGQRKAAILAKKPLNEVLTTQFQIDSTEWDEWQARLSKDGISASTFDKRQKRLLRLILTEIVGIYRDEINRVYLNSIDLDLLTFAWMGETEIGKPHYFRIQGKDFVFELDAAQGDGKHVHTVWRDREDDFGGNTLMEHYEKHEH